MRMDDAPDAVTHKDIGTHFFESWREIGIQGKDAHTHNLLRFVRGFVRLHQDNWIHRPSFDEGFVGVDARSASYFNSELIDPIHIHYVCWALQKLDNKVGKMFGCELSSGHSKRDNIAKQYFPPNLDRTLSSILKTYHHEPFGNV